MKEEFPESLSTKWYESETNRDWVLVLSTLAIMLPYTLSMSVSLMENKIYDEQILASFISLILFSISLVFDKYTTYQGFSLSDQLREKGSEPLVNDLNPDLQHVTTKEEYMESVFRYKDLIIILFSLIPVVGIPMAAQRSFAGLNNIRVTKRIKLEYSQNHNNLLNS